MNRANIRVIIVLTTIALAALFFVLSEARTRIAAMCWHAQLAAVPDYRVEIVVRQIAQSGRSGIAILVAALNSDRECVAQAAKEELIAELARWPALPHGECDSRLTLLTQALAGEVDHFRPAARRAAMDLAARILRQPFGGSDTNKLLAAGEKILRIGISTKFDPGRMQAADSLHAAGLKIDGASADFHLPSHALPESGGQTIADKTTLYGSQSSGEDPSQTAAGQANQPRLLDRQAASRLPVSRGQLPQAARTADRLETPQAVSLSAGSDKQYQTSDRVRPLVYFDSQAADCRPVAALDALSAVDLMRDLNSENDTRAAAAEAELKRRGFTAVHLEAARRMFDPDPAVRKRLVGQLPDLQGIDAVQWLLRLCATRTPTCAWRQSAFWPLLPTPPF